MIYNKYLIREGDHFQEDNFPLVVAELDAMILAMSGMDSTLAAEMFLGFVRDHHLKLEWINVNADVSHLLTSRQINTTCVEALFDSSTQNRIFQHELESYITFRLAPSTISY